MGSTYSSHILFLLTADVIVATGKYLMQVSKQALQKLGASSAEHLHVLWRSIEELREYEAGLRIPDLDEGE